MNMINRAMACSFLGICDQTLSNYLKKGLLTGKKNAIYVDFAECSKLKAEKIERLQTKQLKRKVKL